MPHNIQQPPEAVWDARVATHKSCTDLPTDGQFKGRPASAQPYQDRKHGHAADHTTATLKFEFLTGTGRFADHRAWAMVRLQTSDRRQRALEV